MVTATTEHEQVSVVRRPVQRDGDSVERESQRPVDLRMGGRDPFGGLRQRGTSHRLRLRLESRAR